jgi:succinate dehydrogenase flavin-adding protein (antitoxin of CptAB toxin-antitoxin module)
MLNRDELQILQRLLTYPDDVLLELLMGRASPPDKGLKEVIDKIRRSAAHKT